MKNIDYYPVFHLKMVPKTSWEKLEGWSRNKYGSMSSGLITTAGNSGGFSPQNVKGIWIHVGVYRH